MKFSVRKFENLHIALWLLKDTCWVMDMQTLGVIMIVPTIAVAFFISWQTRRYMAELCHNIAVCLWILANSIWMIGEFFFNDTTRPYATVLFVMGLIVIGYYYLFLFKRAANEDVLQLTSEAPKMKEEETV